MQRNSRYNQYAQLSWPAHIFWSRKKQIPFKKLIKRATSIRNAKGVEFEIDLNQYIAEIDIKYQLKGVDLKFIPVYKIDRPEFFQNFKPEGCVQAITGRLRSAGLLVAIYTNCNRLHALHDSAIAYTGQSPNERLPETFQVAVANGYGEIIVFSEGANEFRGYWLGQEHKLFINLVTSINGQDVERFKKIQRWTIL